MPWEERSLMDVRLRFVQDVHRPGWSVAEVCRRYQVSRKTGYKARAVRESRTGRAGRPLAPAVQLPTRDAGSGGRADPRLTAALSLGRPEGALAAGAARADRARADGGHGPPDPR